MDKVLIDTDVILDFFFDREPFAGFAAEILNLCEENKVIGFTTPVIICNVYYMLRKSAKHEIIVEKIKQLLNVIEIVRMDKEVVFGALNSDFKDFEDALQNFSAIENGEINIIITRNIKDFKESKLAVLSPEMYLKGRGVE
ncbi:PIN domain-containing protein [Belliella sp. DSM 107340]|uniref:PIN domain-containing protein n=1 Tax=Belliella calami TaxID=2923436 RepID=A0ABS9UKT7_9BACT|nr:PIN domain-containing protein [Belliella calami]MCH7397233.1 PIN domain-containing protein [Belliella calami]